MIVRIIDAHVIQKVIEILINVEEVVVHVMEQMVAAVYFNVGEEVID